MKKVILYSLFIIQAISCSKDEGEAYPNISPEFLPYFIKFKQEAASRQTSITNDQIKIEYVDPSEIPNYCGYGDVNPPHVRISNSTGCWSNRSESDKEILMFHELGHALLSRSHLNDTLPNGDYKSMMFGGNQFGLYTELTPERRAYYLDELFNPYTLAPAWARAKTELSSLLMDTISSSFALTKWSYQVGSTNSVGNPDRNNASSASTSLMIKSKAVTSGYSYWVYSFTPPTIPVGARLVLKAKVKVQEVTGSGVHVALRGDIDTSVGFFTTTQGKTVISGTQDFKEYSTVLPYYPGHISKMFIFLLLDADGTGTAYFDDIKLEQYN